MQRDSGPSGMKGAETGTKGAEPGTKASDSTDKMAPSKSAQDSNRMQGEKSKSMHSETNSTKDSAKGSKEMKAEGRDSKSGTTTERRRRKGGDTTPSRAPPQATTKSPDHDGQRRNFGDRCAAGREAHPDRLRHQVGEDPGNHQRELQHFGRRRGACVASASTRFRPGSSRSIRSGVVMR